MHILTVPPYKEPRIQIDNDLGQWYVLDPQRLLEFSWDPMSLADFHDPEDDGTDHMVEIVLMGYTEMEDEDGEMVVGVILLVMLP